MTSQEIESLVRRYNDNLAQQGETARRLSDLQGAIREGAPPVRGTIDQFFWEKFDAKALIEVLQEFDEARAEARRLRAEAEGLEGCLRTAGLDALIR